MKRIVGSLVLLALGAWLLAGPASLAQDTDNRPADQKKDVKVKTDTTRPDAGKTGKVRTDTKKADTGTFPDRDKADTGVVKEKRKKDRVIDDDERRPGADKGDKGASADDATFVLKAGAGNLAEINVNMLALRQTGVAEVRKIAQQMLADHRKANEELNRIALGSGMKIAQTMEEKHRAVVNKLSGLRGIEFDRAYAEAMVKSHEKAKALYEAQARGGQNKALRGYAEKTLPVIEHHLKMVQDLAGRIPAAKDGDGKAGKTKRDGKGGTTLDPPEPFDRPKKGKGKTTDKGADPDR